MGFNNCSSNGAGTKLTSVALRDVTSVQLYPKVKSSPGLGTSRSRVAGQEPPVITHDWTGIDEVTAGWVALSFQLDPHMIIWGNRPGDLVSAQRNCGHTNAATSHGPECPHAPHPALAGQLVPGAGPWGRVAGMLTGHIVGVAVLLQVGFALGNGADAGLSLVGTECLPLLGQPVLVAEVVLHIGLGQRGGGQPSSRGADGGLGRGLPPLRAGSPGSCVRWRCPCWTGQAPRTRRVCCCGSWGWAVERR